ncbi:MAG: Gfo/Idh/MocA family oxidoreductase [Verrucomicrobiales bacterium]|nr:Gfo/Idh/MocA family oxidoreductase [Verrucomicrobiales bacterium]
MRNGTQRIGWGLIGPGRFAQEFAQELVATERAGPVAVASRDLGKAQDFASRFGFEKAHGSYEELFADQAVDIVYIVVPHVFHAEIAKEAILAGKAVLCEKPLTPGPETTRELSCLAKERGVFLMEAMKTGFLPAIQKAKAWIDEGRIGDLRLAQADFCFSGPTDPSDRLMNPELGGGAVLDVGIYPLHLTRMLLGEIESLAAKGTLAETGVEDSTAIVSRHVSGASSAMTCSFRTEEAMSASIFGTSGMIEIPLFHAAKKAILKQGGEVIEVFEDHEIGMVAAEIEAVMDALDEGLIECPGHTHEDSIRLAELMHEVRSQLGSVAT